MSKVASKRLGDLITLKRGYDLPEKVRVAGPYPVISSAGISGYHNAFKVEGPGVVTGRYGTLGEMYYAEGRYWPHNTALYVQDFKGNDPKYIYYLLGCLGRIRTSDKSAVPGVNRNELHEMEIPAISDPSVQVKVRKVLETIDKKVDLNNRINAELESMAKMLYDYWFVQFDFPDANGKPYKTSGGKMVYNATLKREIPAGWDVRALSQIANITMGQSPAGESYNDEGHGTLFFQGSTDFGWLFPSARQYTTSPARMAKKGDILLSVRAPVGDMNIANADCCIGRGLAALNSKSGSDGFLFYVMKYFKQVFERRNSEGTTFGSITKDDLHSLSVAYPQPNLLKRYDDIVSGYNKMIFIRSLENRDLVELRDWLLPLLMNGQVTVK
ncbi:restriction endonuclease subunit S [Salmonella enterica subsp. enterica serovar Stanley]|nr:restriction endonuclease subunit S [Salmonella enterica]ECY8231027.1 restriction endonuclease subunit S [Salmonella enterica subsp. enterica serovar Stanley]EIJ6144148.1 restriction endonuclease subunit S [Salmonella enterica subsp. enterica serovar 4:a:-]EAP0906633.1 restriction endonuclease subunit S [Salmonella enterica]EAZ9271160.1 restriction endonuclease subunit S [Salmonella enterica]